jgi:hypothetical protein
MSHSKPTTILPFVSSLGDALAAFFARWTSLEQFGPTSLLDLEHHLAALLRSFQDIMPPHGKEATLMGY